MSSFDLTGKKIRNTYQRLTQISGSQLVDGTGSLVDNINVTSSFAITSSYAEYAVSASHEIIKEVSSSFADTASYVTPLDQDVTITGNVGIGTTPTEGRLHIKGEGSNSATTAFLVQNAAGADLLKVVNDGQLKLSGNKPISFFGLQAFEGSNQDGGYIRIAENSFWGSTRINSPTNITEGNDAPDVSAMLQVDSTTKGFLPPRMTTTQINNIAEVSAGLIVYDTTIDNLKYHDSSSWNSLSSFPFTGSAQITGSLEVTGSVVLKGAYGFNTPDIYLDGTIGSNNSGTIRIAANNKLQFYDANGEIYRVSGKDANNNTNAALLIRGRSLILTPDNVSAGTNGVLISQHNTIPQTALLTISSSVSPNLLHVGSNDANNALFVSASGNVGIGTSTPEYITDIQSPNQTNNIPAGNDVYNIFNVGYSNSNFNIANKSAFTVGATAQSSGRFVTELRIGGGSDTSAHFMYYGNGNANGFRLDRSNNNLVLFNNVQGNGVIIKQTPDGLSSSARLQVRGDGTTSSTTALLVENSNGDDILKVTDDGAVSVSPDYNGGGFSVNSTQGIRSDSPSNAAVKIVRNNNVGYFAMLNYYDGNSVMWQTGTPKSSDNADFAGTEYIIAQSSRSSPAITINTSNNVGIGTTSPSEKLTVEGNISASGDLAIEGFPSVSASLASAGGGGSAFPFTGSAQIQGLGTTNGTSALKVENATPTTIFDLKDNGQFSVGPSNDSISIASNGRVTIAASAPDLSIGGGNYLDFPGGAGTIDGVRTINRTGEIRVNATQGIRFGNTSNSVGTRVSIVGDNDTIPFGIQQTPGGTTNNILATFKSGSGDIVMGITADGGFTATDSTLVKRYTFEHGYVPSPADGLGIGLDLKTENTSGIITSVGFIDVIQDDISADESSMRLSVGETTPTEIMRLQSDGNVGIGTTDPTSILNVKGSGTTSGTTALRVENNNGDDTFIVRDDGRVGIGVDDPERILDVGNTMMVRHATNPNRKLVIGWGSMYPLSDIDEFQFLNGGASKSGMRFYGRFHSSSPSIGNLFSETGISIGKTLAQLPDSNTHVHVTGSDSDQTLFKVSNPSNPNSFSVSGSGNVGIGTTSPQIKLHISGSSGAASGIRQSRAGVKIWDQQIDSSGRLIWSHYTSEGGTANQLFTLDDNGNVGIGTTSPAAKLDVAGDTDATIMLGKARFHSFVTDYMYLSHYDQGSMTNYALNQSPAGSTSINAPTGQNVSLKINNSTKVILQGTTGNVGIGTTSPSTKLHVDGNIRVGDVNDVIFANKIYGISTGDLTIYTSGNTLLSQTGNVGIGNSTPPQKLTVEGNISASGDLYLDGALFSTSEVTTTTSGNYTIYSIPTSSYDGAFYDYTLRSGSNARAGNIMAIWSGTDVNYTETTTTDFGDTTGVLLDVSIIGENMVLTGSFDTADWNLKTIIRSI